jgi:hypothetical protein
MENVHFFLQRVGASAQRTSTAVLQPSSFNLLSSGSEAAFFPKSKNRATRCVRAALHSAFNSKANRSLKWEARNHLYCITADYDSVCATRYVIGYSLWRVQALERLRPKPIEI